jgi:hypothetical protein
MRRYALIVVLAGWLATPATALAEKADPPFSCPGPAQVLDDGDVSRLTPSPVSFTRTKNWITVPEGAVYDAAGNVICILKHDPGTYLIDHTTALDQAISDEKDRTGFATPSTTFCENLAHHQAKKLNVSNSEFFNRVLWAAGEGDCNVISQSVHDRKGKTLLHVTNGPGAHEVYPIRWASYYHGFVIANLRKRFETESGMLQSAANSGPGTSVFNSYFVNGDGNTKPFFDLILHPDQWKRAAAEQAYASDSAADKIRICLQEMLPSITPGVSDPTGGMATWHHSTTPCPKKALEVKIRFGGAATDHSADTYTCFKERS